MGDVVDLQVITKLDLDPERVLAAAAGKLTEVVIIGTTTDGNEYFASSKSDGGDVIWHLRRAEWRLMKVVDEQGS